MNTISLQVINQKDFNMVMAVLKAFQDSKIIRLNLEDDEEDSLALPGPPVSTEVLLKKIEEAEASGEIELEDETSFHKLIREK